MKIVDIVALMKKSHFNRSYPLWWWRVPWS